MPSIYKSYVIEPNDTLEEKQGKVYLALISAGETAYTLGAAVAELRKQCDAMNKKVDDIDSAITTLRKEFWKLNGEVIKEVTREEPPTTPLISETDSASNENCAKRPKA